ncbi:hypothetical protein HMPREF0058_0306 [Actinomyces urogenitalis DSM 15434]|uniref:Uncharacterized protein n=1 Tax=Actinomyces urogenitalis DSM 15434 TaxID=525246 RepID=C0W362_9ACTO|nr:hypothetical protein HMPREF0058_0306 [Actinomyces urogenitalis DSM 15434]
MDLETWGKDDGWVTSGRPPGARRADELTQAREERFKRHAIGQEPARIGLAGKRQTWN